MTKGKDMYIKYITLTLLDKPCLNIKIFILHLWACITLVIISDSLGPAGSAVGEKGNLTPRASREGLEKGETKSASEGSPGGSLGKGKSTDRLALLVDVFLASSPCFLPFSPTTEPGPRLISDYNFLHLV